MFIAAGGGLMFNGLSDPAVWAALAFVVFLLFLYVKKVHVSVAQALDERAKSIQTELSEARTLREEAQAILADYQSRQRNVEEEVAAIVAQAEREAKVLAEETRQGMAAMLDRRMKSADTKIAQAELQALTEIKQAAADVAARATEQVLRSKADKTAMNATLVEQAIAQLDNVKVN